MIGVRGMVHDRYRIVVETSDFHTYLVVLGAVTVIID